MTRKITNHEYYQRTSGDRSEKLYKIVATVKNQLYTYVVQDLEKGKTVQEVADELRISTGFVYRIRRIRNAGI